MRRYITTVIASLCWIILGSTSAFATLYNNWDSVAPIYDNTHDANYGIDIESIRWAADASGTHYFRMDVLGNAPTIGANYNFFVANDRTMLSPDYIFTDKFKTNVISFSKIFTSNTESDATAHFSYTNPHSGKFFLEWSLVDDASLNPVFYVTGSTYIDPGTNMLHDTMNVASTPIPAAAWLLASGLLSLIGLKRRT